MEIIFFILFGLYLFKLFHNRSKEKREYFEARQELFANTRQILGADALQKLKDNIIWVGMPKCLVVYVYGRPDEVIKRETPGNYEQTWFFEPIQNARSNARRKYKIEIYFHNGFITSWDILT